MSALQPVADANDVASHEPRPIAAVMAEVLERYGLTEPPQHSERVVGYWSTYLARPEQELAIA